MPSSHGSTMRTDRRSRSATAERWETRQRCDMWTPVLVTDIRPSRTMVALTGGDEVDADSLPAAAPARHGGAEKKGPITLHDPPPDKSARPDPRAPAL
jgi:hypothetical protein